MAKFVLMHCGFEPPSPEMMEQWNAWFASIKDRTVVNMGFRNGREISSGGRSELPFGPDSITGISIVEADSLDEAEQMAQGNPFIKSIRIYETMEH